MEDLPELSLVIPCYNEAGNLPALIARIVEVFGDRDAEVILVDNGSTDDTPEAMARLIAGHEFIRGTRVEVNQGYGFGILSGLAVAEGEVLAWTHADLQTDPKDALDGLALFRESPQPDRLFVKGSRYGRGLRDVIFTWGMSLFETLLLGKPLWDINAQPTMFHRRFYAAWQKPPHDFSLDLFAYCTAARHGLRIVRFPVFFGLRHSGVGHSDKISAKLKISMRTFGYSIELRRRLRGRSRAKSS
jgi:polyisoprenyl-phosphate glycosyltransferase